MNARVPPHVFAAAPAPAQPSGGASLGDGLKSVAATAA